MRDLVCAVDVGTGSVRAGLLDRSGALLSRAVRPIAMNRSSASEAEHDSEDIWHAVGEAVREARALAGIEAARVAAIGFDATCSLVIRGEGGAPVSVARDGDPCWDTIAWLDHRATAEAEICTATGHPVLAYSGGSLSPEMQVPKLIWLKRNLPERWAAARLFLDLADFLTWKASGATARSQSTLTCKWTYLAHEGGWQRDFLAAVGLADMLERGGLPAEATPVGAAVGRLTAKAASHLGLDEAVLVGSGLIDAYAGALGAIGSHASGGGIEDHLALIAGTSSCIMGFSRQPRPAPAVWGPYLGAALPDTWIAEGGQSATGALLDHVVRSHGAVGEPDATLHLRIAERIGELRRAEGERFAADLHVLPDFHGNRTPFADPAPRGVASGLALDASFDGLCRLYWRSAVAIALGVRQVLEHLEAHGYRGGTLHAAGGHARNPLLVGLYADVLGRPIIESGGEDAMLLGTAMASAAASGLHESVAGACRAMRQEGRMHAPNPAMKPAHDRDYRIFLRMQEHRREIEALAHGAAGRD